MTTRDDFITHEIVPTLGEFIDHFDLDGIVDEVADFDERDGYTWKEKYQDATAYYDVLPQFDTTTD